MDVKVNKSVSTQQAQAQAQVQHNENESMVLRKGPWTVDEDTILVNYVSTHGEGNWNSVARYAGLKRSGKSCRLRWLNYLRPDVKRGNITLQEQILILDLHSRWGNRWSKIAQQLPGRTDNEIKNYWRTRVIKQAKQLKCDVNSKQFRDALRYVWMPRLLERIHPAASQSLEPQKQLNRDPSETGAVLLNQNGLSGSNSGPELCAKQFSGASSEDSSSAEFQVPSNSDGGDSSELPGRRDVSVQSLENQWSSFNGHLLEQGTSDGGSGGDSLESLWNDENMWFLQPLSYDLEVKFNSLA